MSKKKRTRTQQLLDQKRLLQQQLASHQGGPAVIGKKDELKLEAVTTEKLPIQEKPVYQPTGLRRTVISSLVIVILLSGAYFANKRTSYIQDVGNNLYHSLRLSK